MKHYEVYNRITNDYTDLSDLSFADEGYLTRFDSYDDAYEQVKLWIEYDSKDMIIGDHIDYDILTIEDDEVIDTDTISLDWEELEGLAFSEMLDRSAWKFFQSKDLHALAGLRYWTTAYDYDIGKLALKEFFNDLDFNGEIYSFRAMDFNANRRNRYNGEEIELKPIYRFERGGYTYDEDEDLYRDCNGKLVDNDVAFEILALRII